MTCDISVTFPFSLSHQGRGDFFEICIMLTRLCGVFLGVGMDLVKGGRSGECRFAVKDASRFIPFYFLDLPGMLYYIKTLIKPDS